MNGRLSDEQKDAIISDYRRGRKVDDIAQDHGVPRATVYYVLQTRGVAPSRQRRGPDTTVSADQILARLEACQRDVVRLQIALQSARERLETAGQDTSDLAV